MKNKKNKIIILIFIISLVIFLFTFYLNSKIVLERKEIIAKVEVGDKMGLDLNQSALTFGKIIEGNSLSRKLFLENNYSFPIKLELRAIGDIEKFLVFEQEIYLKSGEDRTIYISAIGPVGEKYGNYSGKLVVIIKRDLFS